MVPETSRDAVPTVSFCFQNSMLEGDPQQAVMISNRFRWNFRAARWYEKSKTRPYHRGWECLSSSNPLITNSSLRKWLLSRSLNELGRREGIESAVSRCAKGQKIGNVCGCYVVSQGKRYRWHRKIITQNIHGGLWKGAWVSVMGIRQGAWMSIFLFLLFFGGYLFVFLREGFSV